MNTDSSIEFFFSPVDAGDHGYLETEDLFNDGFDNLYFYRVEADEEGFRIFDTCGRMIPMDRTDIKNFSNAMFGVSRFYAALDAAEDLFDKRMAETLQLMEFFENN